MTEYKYRYYDGDVCGGCNVTGGIVRLFPDDDSVAPTIFFCCACWNGIQVPVKVENATPILEMEAV